MLSNQYCPVAAVAVGVLSCALMSGAVNATTVPLAPISLTIIVPRIFACWSNKRFPSTAVVVVSTLVLDPSCGTKSPIAPAPSTWVVLIPCTVFVPKEEVPYSKNARLSPLPGLVVLIQISLHHLLTSNPVLL